MSTVNSCKFKKSVIKYRNCYKSVTKSLLF
nr:MAG TPA: hypothetical protein [Caudoviricetes sp.]